MPTFIQTGGAKNNTIVRNTYNGGFTTILRAKDKGTRIKIAAIAEAAYKCGGMHYTNGGRMGLYNAFKKGGNYNARLKIAKTKAKGKGVDCSGFSCACTYGAGDPIGSTSWAPNSGALVKGTFSNYTKHNYQDQVRANKHQRGDIVAYPSKTKGGMGHVAVIVESGSAIDEEKYFFKNYYKDGSKKITNKKTEKIKKYIKNYKTDLKKKKKKSKQALKNYLAKLKKDKKTINDKYKKWKNKKNKTKAQEAYTKTLKKTLDKIKKAITATEKAIREYKEPKARPKTQNTAANDYTNWDEGTDDYDDEYDTETDNAEPVITPEKVDWYYVRSGLNYFSEEEIYDSQNQKVRHKDYMGKIYCKRKLKIPMINVTKNYWDFSFDMPFTSCSSYSANIKSAAMVGGDTTKWRYYLNTNGMGQIQGGIYTIIMKTGSGIEYEIRCEIDTYYDI